MPPKRKAAAAAPESRPKKRVTRSAPQTSSVTPPPVSPTKVTRAYTTKKRPLPKGRPAGTPKKPRVESEDEKQCSEDELDSFSPEKPVREEPVTPVRARISTRSTPKKSNPSPVSPSKKRKASDPSPKRKIDEVIPDSDQEDEDDADNIVPVPSSPLSVALPPPTSPSKRKKLVGSLPNLLHECLTRQKRVALRALLTASDISFDDSQDEEEAANDVAFQEVKDLLLGTVERNEGNSCLILGPPGSGKTAIVERCLSELKVKPIVIRLSGWVQQNDRAAFREMARQLDLQTDGNTISMVPDDEDDSNPFLDTPDTSGPSALPPSSHLHALAAMLPKMKRPTIVIIEGFDHFTLHARQALLYCLLDTVQGCHTGTESKGLAVLGITARVDTINLLEKRVKSRFSGRMIRTAPPNKLNQWIQRAKCIFSTVPENSASDWQDMWSGAVAEFFADRNTIRLLNETFSLTRDVCTLNRILTSTIASLSPASPFPLSSQLASSSASQRSGLRFPFLADLSYPALSLLIASYHAETAGYPFVTFEMLWDYFRVEVRTTAAAPVQLHGGGIGMIDCEKEVLLGAFEGLVSQRIFVPAAAPSLVTKAFVRYRGVLGREEIKTAVEQSGQTTLKKWLGRKGE